MRSKSRIRWAAGLAALALVGVAAACGGEEEAAPPPPAATTEEAPATEAPPATTEAPPETTEAATTEEAPADPFGTPNEATGEPLVFGLLNVEAGPITFPEVRIAEEAAAQYVNEYLGGINGRPIEIVSCVTDLQASTSQRCANQILDENPVAILGSADPGSPGAIPVWERANLAYLGGAPFTPVEQASPNAVIFSSISIGDNAAASVFAAQELGATTASVVYTDDPPGQFSALAVIVPTMKNVGFTKVTEVPIPQTAADASSYAAAAWADEPDVIYVDSPNACPAVLKALVDIGSTAEKLGIDPCTDPRAIEAAGGGAEGLYFAAPVLPLSSDDPDVQLFNAVMAKYAPADTTLNTLTVLGFQTVMNAWEMLSTLPEDQLTTEGILNAFRTGSDHHNFMAHPYTCDGNQLAGAPALCNAYQIILQIQDGKPVQVHDWMTAAEYYQPPAG